MKKLLNYLWHLFYSFRLLDIDWSPYNGGSSKLFQIIIFEVMIATSKNALSHRSLFMLRAENFYQWQEYRYDLDILFIHVLKANKR